MASSAVEASQALLQTETRVQRSYRRMQRAEQRTEQRTEQRAEQRTEQRVEQRTEQHIEQNGEQHAELNVDTQQLKKKKSTRRHKDVGSISVSKSSERLRAKLAGEAAGAGAEPACAGCGRPVFAVERVLAERRTWHRDCFRCAVCRKRLSVESYQSEQAALYCRAHFRQLHEPPPAADAADADTDAPGTPALIVCESKPVELPPDVVRGSAGPELGLESLAELDVRSRFQLFERGARPASPPPPPAARPAAPAPALRKRLARFSAAGADTGVGVPHDSLRGAAEGEDDSEGSDASEGSGDADAVLRQSYLVGAREAPVPAANLGELLGRWESGAPDAAARRHERKQELQNIRSRLFMGKQAKIKEMYEQSVLQSEQGVTSGDRVARELELDGERARAIKQSFESGRAFVAEDAPRRAPNDSAVFEHGLGKQSRSLFLQLDATAQGPPLSPPPQEPPRRRELPFTPAEVVRADDAVEEPRAHTADISDRFRFFETYREQPPARRREFRMTPPRDGPRAPSPEPYREPDAVRCEPTPPDASLAAQRQTASRMISVFRGLEERQQRAAPADAGPKPLKRFTPPPPGERAASNSGDSDGYSDSDSDVEPTRRTPDELLQAMRVCRERSLRERRPRSPSRSPPRTPAYPAPPHPANDDEGDSQFETAKSLRDKFENLRAQPAAAPVRATPAPRRFL